MREDRVVKPTGNSADQSRFVLAVTLWSLLAFAGLATPRLALAAAPPQPVYTYFGPGGTVLITRVKQTPSPKCPEPADLIDKYVRDRKVTVGPPSMSPFEKKCLAGYAAFVVPGDYLGPLDQAMGASIGATVAQSLQVKPLAVTPPMLLTLTTPFVPFLGNRLAVLGKTLDTKLLTDATTGYSVGLRRQTDCTITADFLTHPDAPSPNAVGVISITGAQDYFHQLAGLTTTANVFAQGCSYPLLGQPTDAHGLLMGTTASGKVFSAALSNSGLLQILGVDSVANVYSTATIGTGIIGAIAAADLNGDGNLDLVATYATNPVSMLPSTAVYLGNSDGTFNAAAYYDVPGDITIEDVNGNGIPDVVVCGGAAPGITTLSGNGNGTFTIGPTSATSAPACFQAAGRVLSGDFNGDGRKDLLVQGTVLLGNGDGTFAVGSPVTTDSTFVISGGFNSTALGDVNKDGKLDVVVSQEGFVALFYGRGDGTFTPGPRYAALPDYEKVSITDIDGDGNPDVVLGASTGGIYSGTCCDGAPQPAPLQLLMGRGDGTFVDSVAYNQGRYGAGSMAVPGPQIATADFNGDGMSDALVANPTFNIGQPSALAMLPGDGTGRLGTVITSSVANGPTMVVAADMNKDGKPDVVLAGVVQAGPQLSVVLNQGNGSFASEQAYSLPDYPTNLAAGDFDGDGLKDVAVGVAPNVGGSGLTGVYLLRGQSNGTLAAAVRIDASLSPTGMAAADLNGDGRTDLVVADQGFAAYVGSPNQVNGSLHVYLGNANGTFTSIAAPTTSATNYGVLALGDLNGDGKLDLVVGGTVVGTSIGADGAPAAYAFLGRGDGTFNAAVKTALPGNYGIGTTSITLADFNKDGRLDVAVGDLTAFTGVLLGAGDGRFSTVMMALGQLPGALAASDLDGDGFPELLVGTTNPTGSSHLTVFRNSSAWAAVAALPATTTTLTGTATSVSAGQPLTLTATVAAASGTTVPSGSVTFLDGATTLSTAALDATGKAIFTTSSLGQGSHTLQATYGGSTAFSGSTSTNATVTVTAPAPDFSVSVSPSTLTVAAGQTGTLTLTVMPLNGSTQTVAVSCGNLPAHAVCGFAPAASVSLNGTQASSITITVRTSVVAALNTVRTSPLAASFGSAGGVLLVLAASGAALRRRGRLALLAAAMGFAIASCGGGGASAPGGTVTPAGNYPLTITLTAGATTHTANVSLTVQ